MGSCTGDDDRSNNIALGKCSSTKLTGDYNITIGNNASEGTTASCRNISMGLYARADVGAGGTDNVFVGYYAGHMSGDIESGIGIGAESHYNLQGSHNVAIGCRAMRGAFQGEGTNNIAIGKEAGVAINDGTDNIFLGQYAGAKSADVFHNIFGLWCRCCTTAGSYNVYLIQETGKCNVGGACNVYIGNRTGFAATGGEQNETIVQSVGITTLVHIIFSLVLVLEQIMIVQIKTNH